MLYSLSLQAMVDAISEHFDSSGCKRHPIGTADGTHMPFGALLRRYVSAVLLSRAFPAPNANEGSGARRGEETVAEQECNRYHIQLLARLLVLDDAGRMCFKE